MFAVMCRRMVLPRASIAASLLIAIAVVCLPDELLAQENDTCNVVREFGLARFADTKATADGCSSESTARTSRSAEDSSSPQPDVSASEQRQDIIDSNYDENARIPRSIYVEDDRIEALQYSALQHPKADALKNAIAATAILTLKRDLVSGAGGHSKIQLSPYRVPLAPLGRVPLCPGEAFSEQRTGGFCTAFLVAPDVVATAGHCVNFEDVTEQDVSKNTFSVVFGFEIRNGKIRDEITASEIFDVVHIRELSQADHSSTKPDFALLQLDRPVPESIAVPLKLTGLGGGAVQPGTRLGLIGHPSGLPKKVSFNGLAVAMETGTATGFRAQLNAFKGNSGSPVVYYDEPDVLAGILVNGQSDFAPDVANRCVRTQVYLANQVCDGQRCSEGVTKAAVLVPYLP